MMKLCDRTTATISIQGIDLLALKRLSLVSHLLADKIGGEAGREQRCLAGVLDDVIRQIELAAARASLSQKDGGGG